MHVCLSCVFIEHVCLSILDTEEMEVCVLVLHP